MKNEFNDNEDLLKLANNSIARRSTFVSVFVNIVLTGIQVSAGLFSGATSLVADGVHSLSDLISDFVVLFAKHYSQKDADDDHPYGHQRYENAASLFLGILLFAVAIGMVVSAVGKIENHESLSKVTTIALWVALFSLISKELLFRYMLREAQKIKSSLLIANAWHARSDAASSLVASVGIIGNLSGYYFLDPVAAIVVGFVVGKMGAKFMWDSLHDLMDRTVDEKTINEVRQILLSSNGIKGLHDLKARKMGDLLIVDVHLEIDKNLSVAQGHQIALDARNQVLKNSQILNVMTHVDPV